MRSAAPDPRPSSSSASSGALFDGAFESPQRPSAQAHAPPASASAASTGLQQRPSASRSRPEGGESTLIGDVGALLREAEIAAAGVGCRGAGGGGGRGDVHASALLSATALFAPIGDGDGGARASAEAADGREGGGAHQAGSGAPVDEVMTEEARS